MLWPFKQHRCTQAREQFCIRFVGFFVCSRMNEKQIGTLLTLPSRRLSIRKTGVLKLLRKLSVFFLGSQQHMYMACDKLQYFFVLQQLVHVVVLRLQQILCSYCSTVPVGLHLLIFEYWTIICFVSSDAKLVNVGPIYTCEDCRPLHSTLESVFWFSSHVLFSGWFIYIL